MTRIDAVGRSCPEPVIMLKKALADKPASLEIAVHNAAARGNCTRFASHAGYAVSETQEGPVWVLKLDK